MKAPRSRAPWLAAWLATFGAVAAVAPAEAADAPVRNVLLVTLDTFRGDYLAASGKRPIPTPHLDRLAAGGARFTRARAVAPLTLPSHASILTGTWPHTHGLRDNGAGVLGREHPTLTARLEARGYDTAAFIGSFVLDRRFGLDRGFDHYDDRVATDLAELESVEAERDGAEVVAAFEAWLAARQGAAPFFAWVHLYDPHAPYAAPEPFASRHRGDPYGAEIAYTDALVGRLMAALEARGPGGQSVVAVVGDHGEGLGEHGEQTHALLIYNSTLSVPMIVWAPGLVSPRVVPDLVRTIDLAPTLLDLLAADSALGEGRSLAPLLRGAALQEAPAFSESRYAERHLGWSPLHAVEEGRHKYIAAPTPELYDVLTDPGETSNRAAAAPEEVARLDALLRATVDLEPDEAPVAALDRETAARLRDLGYLTSSAPPASAHVDPKDRIDLWERLQQALALYGRGDYAAAAGELEAVLRRERAIPLVYDTLGACYMRLDRPEEAERLYTQALQRGIETAALRLDLGLIHARREAVARAEAEFRQALLLEPLNPAAHHHLGDLYRSQGRAREAAAEYRAALAISPRYVYAWNGLGRTLADLGEAHAALAAFERAVEIGPREPEALFNLAVQLERMGRVAEALARYEACLALAPGSEIGALAARAVDRLDGD